MSTPTTISWETLVAREPRLQDLVRVAEQAGRNDLPQWPKLPHWRGHVRRLLDDEGERQVAVVALLGIYRTALSDTTGGVGG